MSKISLDQESKSKFRKNNESEIKYIIQSESNLKIDNDNAYFKNNFNQQQQIPIENNNYIKPKTFDKKLFKFKSSGIFSEKENNHFSKSKSKIEKNSNSKNYFKKNPTLKNENQKFKKSLKDKIRNILDHKITAIILTLATLYALILSDFNIIFFSPNIDIIFSILSTGVFFLFLFEFILLLIVKKEYSCSFIFWLDLASIFSMLINIDWLVYPCLELFLNITSSDGIRNKNFQSVIRNLSGVVKATR